MKVTVQERDESVDRLRQVARVWDNLIRIPVLGRRIGLDALVGLVPGLGDVAGGALGIYGLVTAARLRVGPVILMRMLLNIGIDTLVGLVPVLGDLFDVAWKANTKNLALVERWLADPDRVERSSGTVLAIAVLGVVAIIGGAIWVLIQAVRMLPEVAAWP